MLRILGNDVMLTDTSQHPHLTGRVGRCIQLTPDFARLVFDGDEIKVPPATVVVATRERLTAAKQQQSNE